MQPIQKSVSSQYATQAGYLPPRSPHRPYSQAPQQPPTPLPLRQRPLNFRKNACAVCRVCFTCAKFYGQDCECPEMHPRRGKNLPPNTVDSRSKRLVPSEVEDYQITMDWLEQNANDRYKDTEGRLPPNISEFALCKAHSSSLYRAKKRAESNLALRAEQDYTSSAQLPMSLPPGFEPTPSSSAKRKRLEDNVGLMRRMQHRASFPMATPYHVRPQQPLTFGPVVETISLRSALTEQERNNPSLISSAATYYLRNLAITDTFTFRDILREIDLTGNAPPPGKKIVITNIENDRTFPMDIPIRSAIQGRPHIDLCIDLQDIVSFNVSGSTQN
ncbi:hypothetical protein INT44_001310 [Umbelopsis vinacea]|uniref:Uncharacterized protein n=1 Tax=Umbelopsis vinacea TaxID=44442 RepID=A0A8H7UJS4_9FUNG|nr:hypothetical protein INT44_001310 [Umbelopsis vinacea]